MKKLTFKIIITAFIISVSLPALNPHTAFSASAMKPFKVAQISISGLYSVERTEFIHMLGIHEGDIADENKIREGIKSVFKKGFFNDIKVYGNYNSGMLTVDVKERAIVTAVDITISGSLSKKTIREVFSLKEGMEYHQERLDAAIKELTQVVNEMGFPGATINAVTTYEKIPGKVRILLNVKAGEPVRIKRVMIKGGQHRVRDLLDIHESDIFDKRYVDDKLKELKIELVGQGYYNPVVTYTSFDSIDGVLVIDVKTGKKLAVTFNGNDLFSTKKLKQEMPFFEYGSVGTDIVEEAKQSIISLYHQKGYIDISIEYEIKDHTNEVEVIFNISEGKKYKVDKIIFSGVSLDTKQLKSVLYTKEGEPFDPDVKEDDVTALTDYYHSMGFLSVKLTDISTEMNKNNGKVTVHIAVEEGHRLIIKQVKVIGAEHLKEPELMNLIKIKPQTFYSETDVFDARQVLLSYVKQQGYANGDVKVSYEMDSEAQVTLIFHITEGSKYYFGNTLVKGNVAVRWEVFRRELKHTRGEPFNVTTVYEEVRDLYKTGLFTSVDVEFVEQEGGIKDVVFYVKESNAGLVEYGLGYGEYDGLRGFMDIKYINLMGMNRQLSLNTKLSFINHKVSLNYYEPWFVKTPLPFSATVSYERRDEKNTDTRDINYRVQRFTATLGVEKELIPLLKGKLFYEFNLVKTWDVQPDVILSHEDTGTLAISSIVPSIVYDSRDNPLEPTSGFTGGIHVKLASKVLFSETDFVKISGYSNYYIGLTKGLVLAMSLRSGIGQGWRDTVSLPIIERYFLGGGTTVRGYGQDSMGPRGSNGDPTGGNAFLMSNVEWRINILSSLGLVLFTDGGNVWSQLHQYSLNDINYTAGGGIRYNTPVGPLRLDYGHKLNRKEDESPGRFYFSIGQAF
ncbi:MAG: outer membrane protein assembly factor BamA [Nitrospirae bacterium YQR-1]